MQRAPLPGQPEHLPVHLRTVKLVSSWAQKAERAAWAARRRCFDTSRKLLGIPQITWHYHHTSYSHMQPRLTPIPTHGGCRISVSLSRMAMACAWQQPPGHAMCMSDVMFKQILCSNLWPAPASHVTCRCHECQCQASKCKLFWRPHRLQQKHSDQKTESAKHGNLPHESRHLLGPGGLHDAKRMAVLRVDVGRARNRGILLVPAHLHQCQNANHNE